MNWWLEEARHMDPLKMLAQYIFKLNVLFERRRNEYAPMAPRDLPKDVAEMYNQSRDEGRKLDVRQHTRVLFEVQRPNDPSKWHKVNLADRSCSCGFYREHGIPCRHMWAALMRVQECPREFVVKERLVSALKSVYTGFVIPVDQTLLIDDGLRPPEVIRQRGRPKVKRYQSAAEKGPRKKVKCGHCGETGHNVRTCPQKRGE